MSVSPFTTPHELREEVQTCACCRKKRKCRQSHDAADKLTGKVPSWAPRYCIRECWALSPLQRKAKRDAVYAARTPKPRFAYPCVGGPLDRYYAVTTDFYNDGIYAHLTKEYSEYNCAYGRSKKIGSFPPSMIFIHHSLLQPLARPYDR